MTPRRNRSAGVTLFALGVCAFPAVSSAQVTTANESAVTTRTMALGGGAYAAAQSTSSIYVNPAAMSMSRVYHVDASTLFDPSVSRWAFGGAVIDSTRTIGAGLSYTYSTMDNAPDVRHGHDVRLALGALLTEGLSIGITGRYMNHTGTPTANGRLGTAWDGFTLDAGVVVRPARFITLAVTGYSLTNPDTALSPISVGGGVALYPVENLTIVADTVWDLRTWGEGRGRISGGVEDLASRIPLRLGYNFDDTRQTPVHAITGGFGFIEQAFGAEASVRQEIVGGSQTTILVNLRYFYRAM
jgi:hypothetical protein